MLHVFQEIIKKTPADVITLHLCTENVYDMIYSCWDIRV